MNISFILMIISASSLPLLAFLSLVLRRRALSGTWKIILMVLGMLLLCFAIVSTFIEHGDELGMRDIFVAIITGSITVLILSKFSHGHTHAKEQGGAKGIVISEAFHSLIDGAVIGATYLVSPLLGYAATVGIIIHELPKIVGTLAILRSLGLSMKKTVWYGILAQIGSPVAAIFIYLMGKQVDHEQFHALEIASVSSLGAIVLWIIYLEIRFHAKHPHSHDSPKVHSHHKE